MSEASLVWHGPRELTKVRQVCIPVKLLRALGLESGDDVEFALDPERDEIRIRRAAPEAAKEQDR